MYRRAFITGATACMLAAPAKAQPITPGATFTNDATRIGWEEFIARAQGDALRLASDRSQVGQHAYLHAIAQHAARLGELPAVEPEEFGGLEPSYSFDMIRFAAPFAVIYWRMEAGAMYPAHNHPGTNVCTLCTSGRAMVRNFNLVDAPPVSDHERPFAVVETGHDLLEPGIVNMVGEHRNNVHWFEAGPEGAEGLDITTTYGAMQPFSFMQLTPAGAEAPGAQRYRARWVGLEARRALEA